MIREVEVMDGTSEPLTDTLAEGLEESSASRRDVAMTGSSVATLNLENAAAPLESALAEVGRKFMSLHFQCTA